jgi:phosphotransferase system IIB component
MILDVIFEPWFLALVISLGALLVLAIIFIIIVSKKRKGKPKHIKVDDEFINNLLELLGTKDNIEEVSVDNGRLKFKVADLEPVNLEGIKSIATSGVFVTGNIIKTLFKLDSQTIKKAIEKYL